ncbi:MAG: hypothetical protein M1833_002674 [Piccolia ochrophora]|nr:MAG: hypothetical protein M1833_002674 [Piccolia ochrophora]
MSFFPFVRRQKNVAELARSAKELISRLDAPGPSRAEELSKVLSQMKFLLQGTHEAETESSPEQVHQLVTAIVQEDLLLTLARSIHTLPFESRKDTQVIFSFLLRYKQPTGTATEPLCVNYMVDNRPEIIVALCRGYDHRESALPCGTVLREALKHDAVVATILYDDQRRSGGSGGSGHRALSSINPDIPHSGQGVFWRFFDWIDKGAFEVSADAFTTFRELLTKHKPLMSQYLTVNFDLFFHYYNAVLVQSSSYVTKRQSIKLLGEILLDRANYQVMTEYVDRGEHLKLCMNLLKDERRMVQYEGFHVFKVFVANPHKSYAVQKILWTNRERLLRFLPTFLADRTDDDQFTDEKEFLIRQIESMPPVPAEPPAVPPPKQQQQQVMRGGGMTAAVN